MWIQQLFLDEFADGAPLAIDGLQPSLNVMRVPTADRLHRLRRAVIQLLGHGPGDPQGGVSGSLSCRLGEAVVDLLEIDFVAPGSIGAQQTSSRDAEREPARREVQRNREILGTDGDAALVAQLLATLDRLDIATVRYLGSDERPVRERLEAWRARGWFRRFATLRAPSSPVALDLAMPIATPLASAPTTAPLELRSVREPDPSLPPWRPTLLVTPSPRRESPPPPVPRQTQRTTWETLAWFTHAQVARAAEAYRAQELHAAFWQPRLAAFAGGTQRLRSSTGNSSDTPTTASALPPTTSPSLDARERYLAACAAEQTLREELARFDETPAPWTETQRAWEIARELVEPWEQAFGPARNGLTGDEQTPNWPSDAERQALEKLERQLHQIRRHLQHCRDAESRGSQAATATKRSTSGRTTRAAAAERAGATNAHDGEYRTSDGDSSQIDRLARILARWPDVADRLAQQSVLEGARPEPLSAATGGTPTTHAELIRSIGRIRRLSHACRRTRQQAIAAHSHRRGLTTIPLTLRKDFAAAAEPTPDLEFSAPQPPLSTGESTTGPASHTPEQAARLAELRQQIGQLRNESRRLLARQLLSPHALFAIGALFVTGLVLLLVSIGIDLDGAELATGSIGLTCIIAAGLLKASFEQTPVDLLRRQRMRVAELTEEIERLQATASSDGGSPTNAEVESLDSVTVMSEPEIEQVRPAGDLADTLLTSTENEGWEEDARAERRRQEWLAQLEEWDLPHDLSPRAVVRALRRRFQTATRTHAEAVAAWQADWTALQLPIDRWCLDAAESWNACLPDSPADAADHRPAVWRDRLQQALDDLRTQPAPSGLEAESDISPTKTPAHDVVQELELWQRRLRQAKQRRQRLLDTWQVEDAVGLEQKIAEGRAWSERAAQQREAQLRLEARLSDEPHAEQIREWLSERVPQTTGAAPPWLTLKQAWHQQREVLLERIDGAAAIRRTLAKRATILAHDTTVSHRDVQTEAKFDGLAPAVSFAVAAWLAARARPTGPMAVESTEESFARTSIVTLIDEEPSLHDEGPTPVAVARDTIPPTNTLADERPSASHTLAAPTLPQRELEPGPSNDVAGLAAPSTFAGLAAPSAFAGLAAPSATFDDQAPRRSIPLRPLLQATAWLRDWLDERRVRVEIRDADRVWVTLADRSPCELESLPESLQRLTVLALQLALAVDLRDELGPFPWLLSDESLALPAPVGSRIVQRLHQLATAGQQILIITADRAVTACGRAVGAPVMVIERAEPELHTWQPTEPLSTSSDVGSDELEDRTKALDLAPSPIDSTPALPLAVRSIVERKLPRAVVAIPANRGDDSSDARITSRSAIVEEVTTVRLRPEILSLPRPSDDQGSAKTVIQRDERPAEAVRSWDVASPWQTPLPNSPAAAEIIEVEYERAG